MWVRASSRARSAVVAVAIAAGASQACVNLDDVTTVKDLRVLSVQADKPGFLVNLDQPDQVAPADLQATLTALVVDPKAPGGAVFVTATACPDLLDTITGASAQATSLCSPSIPGYTVIAPADASGTPPITTIDQMANAAPDIEFHPALTPFGFTPGEVGMLFTPMPSANPAVAQAIQYNRDFGVAANVGLTFALGSEQAVALKRIIYWPDLRAMYPDEVPNRNPGIDRIELYRHRDANTGEPIDIWTDTPTVSIGAKDELFVLPVPAADAIETYPLRSRNTQTNQVETREVQELLVFDFFATAGTFAPALRRNEVPVFAAPGSRIHLDSRYNLPSAADLAKLGPSGVVDIWIIVHDERGGESWAHTNIMVTP
jgi:hypothetical protein